MKTILSGLTLFLFILAMPSGRSSAAQEEDLANLKLRDWEPSSMMVTQPAEIRLPRYPVVDVHNHLRDGSEVGTFLREMDAAGVFSVVNLDGGTTPEEVRERIARLDDAHPGRFLTFARIDFSDFDDPDWSRKATERLAACFDAGAKGVKISKALGLNFKHADGRLIKIDDPRIDPLWALCGERDKPVMIHSADPAAFFTPLDRFNERWHELGDRPHWSFHGPQFPSREELLEARNRVIERHPGTLFIGAHVGNNPEDLATVGRWLEKYPNFVIDIDARISELGRQPYTARRFLIQWQDRVMFGTDTTPRDREAFRIYYRFLETDDEYFDPEKSHHRQGFWMIYGVFLPDEVLRKMYYENALKYVPALRPHEDRLMAYKEEMEARRTASSE